MFFHCLHAFKDNFAMNENKLNKTSNFTLKQKKDDITIHNRHLTEQSTT